MKIQDWYQYVNNTTQQIVQTLQQDWANLSNEQWLQAPNAQSWSMAACLEHLNIYARFYHQEIENAIEQAPVKHQVQVSEVRTNWLGKLSINGVKLNEAGEPMKKVKTLKKFEPMILQQSPQAIYQEFLQHQQRLLELIVQAQQVNLNRLKIKTSLHSLIKLRLGDCIHFVVAHNQRHMAQAHKVAMSGGFVIATN